MTAPVTIRIQEADFDIGAEIAALTRGRSDIGAVVSFSGICRGADDGDEVAALTLEHYPGHGRGRDRPPCRRGAEALAADRRSR